MSCQWCGGSVRTATTPLTRAGNTSSAGGDSTCMLCTSKCIGSVIWIRGYIVRVRGYLLEYYGSGGFTSERVLDLSCKLNTYYHMWIALFYSLKFTMFSLPSLLHIHKNYLHAGIQECDMMISPTSLIKHCKIRDYAGPPRVTFQGSCLRGDSGC